MLDAEPDQTGDDRRFRGHDSPGWRRGANIRAGAGLSHARLSASPEPNSAAEVPPQPSRPASNRATARPEIAIRTQAHGGASNAMASTRPPKLRVSEQLEGVEDDLRPAGRAAGRDAELSFRVDTRTRTPWGDRQCDAQCLSRVFASRKRILKSDARPAGRGAEAGPHAPSYALELSAGLPEPGYFGQRASQSARAWGDMSPALDRAKTSSRLSRRSVLGSTTSRVGTPFNRVWKP